MDRRYRLRGSTNFKRVRQEGIACAHPLFVLIYRSTATEQVRIGISAGRSIGNAVQRNRAKRRLRAAIQPFLKQIREGTEIVILARKPILQAEFARITKAMANILEEQHLIDKLSYETQAISSRSSS